MKYRIDRVSDENGSVHFEVMLFAQTGNMLFERRSWQAVRTIQYDKHWDQEVYKTKKFATLEEAVACVNSFALTRSTVKEGEFDGEPSVNWRNPL